MVWDGRTGRDVGERGSSVVCEGAEGMRRGCWVGHNGSWEVGKGARGMGVWGNS